MKKSILLIILLLIGAGLLLFWKFQHTRLAITPNESTNAIAEVETNESFQTTNPQGNASEPENAGSNIQEQLEKLAQSRGVSLNVLTQQAVTELSNEMLQASQQVNSPIEFYGKVIDESGSPLEGALVEFGCIAFPEDFFGTNALTDANGFFLLTSVTGTALTILVSKEGYEEVKGANQNKFMYYGNIFHPNQNDPVVFRLQKKPLQ